MRVQFSRNFFMFENDGVENMQLYMDVSLKMMAEDYEVVRHYLQIDKWMGFGGSWGSTLALEYAMRFPEVCLGLIVRGIFLNTAEEIDSVYSRDAYVIHQGK